jgi:sensor histidine kinase regulating citrate/malate metabolism
MISRSEILDLFQPILTRIDLGIIFADPEGQVLTCNEAARQNLYLEQDEGCGSFETTPCDQGSGG